MIRKTVPGARSYAGRLPSTQEISPEFLVWRFVCAALALWVLFFVASAFVRAAEPGLQTPAKTDTDSARARMAERFGSVPLSFEPNLGQSSPEVQFLSRNSGYSLFLAPGEAVLRLKRQNPLPDGRAADGNHPVPPIDVLRMRLVGANATPAPAGLDPLPGVISYFVGNDPQKWHTGIPTYAKVNYAGIYPGIDLVFYGSQRQLEYDFVVAPGSDPAQIAWSIEGARPHVDQDGNLELDAPGGPVNFLRPVAYQVIEGKRREVTATYALAGATVRFELGPYDHRETLTIDPVLSYFSYLGGTGSDYIGNPNPGGVGSAGPEPTQAVGIDAQGNLYVGGSTTSTDFPVVAPVLPKTTKAGTSNTWAFVSKFSPDGSTLLYSTYLGGSSGGSDAAYAIAVDSTGNAYVTGEAGTNDFPVTGGAFQTVCGPIWDSLTNAEAASCGGGTESAFVLKLNPTGSSLLYSSFLGGQSSWGSGIAVDGVGQAYVTGVSQANTCAGPAFSHGAQYACFPTTANAAISDIGGGNPLDMAFMTVFNATGTGLVYSTLFGDTQGGGSVNGGGCTTDCNAPTHGTAIALDPAGNVYIGGWTVSSHLLLTPGAFNTTGSGPNPLSPQQVVAPGGYGYVAKFAPVTASGTSLVYSTYFGGGAVYGGDVGGLAADAAGNAYITGATHAPDFPATSGAYQTTCDPNQLPTYCNQGSYVAKLNPTGTALVWATYLGNGSNAPLYFQGPIVLDSAQNVYVEGQGIGQLPLGGGTVSTLNTAPYVYVAKFNSTGSQVLFGAAISGSGAATEHAGGLAVDSTTGAIYVGGSIGSGSTYAGTTGAFQPAYAGGGSDGFVAKVMPFQTSTTALTLSASTITVGKQITLTAKVAGPSGSPIPTGTVTFKNGTTTLGTGTLDATGTATYATSTLTASSYSLTADYSGDANYSSSSSPAVSLTINPITTTTALTIAPNPATTGQSVTFTATVTPASGSAVPTGTVTFINGTTQLSAIALGANGKAVFTTSSLAAATYSVTAAYSGDSDNASSSSGAVSLVVNKAAVATSTTISTSSAAISAGASVTFTAKVTPASGTVVPTGTVTFMDGSTTLGTGTLNGSGQATYTTSSLAPGAHSVTASYGGDAGDSASVSAAVAVAVNPLATTTALTASASSIAAGANVTFTATVAGPAGSGVPTGTVTFLNGTTTLGSTTLNTSGVATYSTTSLPTGSDSITASYAANGVFAASVSAAVVVTVAAPPAPDFSLSVAPTSGTVTNGTSATITVTITPINGFSAATSLACSGLPTNATCTFSPASVTPKGAPVTSTLTISTNTKTAGALAQPQLPSREYPKGPASASRLTMSLASLFVICGLGFTSRKARRNWMRYMGMIVVLAVISGTAIGCSAGKKTPPGQYSVTVTGTSGSLTHSRRTASPSSSTDVLSI